MLFGLAPPWLPAATVRMAVPAPPLPVHYDIAAIERHFAAADATFLPSRALLLLGLSARTSVDVLRSRGDWSVAAPSVRRALETLGPTFVKLGQALASRPDLVGPELADELRLLQDSMPTFSTAEARAIIEAELGAAAGPLLEVLPSEPSAAASIGQVYRVHLSNESSAPKFRSKSSGGWRLAGGGRFAEGGVGRTLAVKVQRREVRRQVAADALLLRRAAAFIERCEWRGQRIIKPALIDGCDEFFGRLWEEMDYRREARNLRDFAELYGRPNAPPARALRRSGLGEVLCPEPVPELSTGRVLTMGWLEGAPLLAKGSSTLGVESLPLVRLGIRATLSQLLETGVMHADPHAGNLLEVITPTPLPTPTVAPPYTPPLHPPLHPSLPPPNPP